MTPLRPVLSIIAALGVALILYGAFYTHGNPMPKVGDPLLAARLIPLELLTGALAGVLVWRSFGARLRRPARDDAQSRMVLRLAHRCGGRFTLGDLEARSPLTREQAQGAVAELLASGRLRRDGETYRLNP